MAGVSVGWLDSGWDVMGWMKWLHPALGIYMSYALSDLIMCAKGVVVS